MAKSVKQPVETPPYLKQVRIRDYAPLRDAKVDFKPGLNIVIGNNGAGKTRLLKLTNGLIELYNFHTEGAGCEIVIGGIHGIHEIKAVFNPAVIDDAKEDNQNLFDDLPSLSIDVSDGLETITTDILDDAIDDLMESRFQSLISYSFSYLPILIQHGTPLSKLPIIDTGVELAFGRLGAVVNSGEIRKRPHGIESRLVRNILYSLGIGFRRQLFVKGKKEKQLIDTKSAKLLISKVVDAFLFQVNACLSAYSPIEKIECSESFQVYQNEAQDELIVKGLVFEYYTKRNSSALPFSALSDGTKRLVYIVTEMLAPSTISFTRENILNGFREEPKIIFLEEPELGIHPEQLHKLLSLIREVSREHQVILTTHSPQVLDMLSEKELDRITICELDAKKGTQFRKLSRAKQAEARAYMREQLHLSDFWRYADLEAKD